MTVTVYTLPNCVQCNTTKRLMDQLGIEYTTVDLTEHPELVKLFQEKNLTAAPIVAFKDQLWSGFKYDKIKAITRVH